MKFIYYLLSLSLISHTSSFAGACPDILLHWDIKERSFTCRETSYKIYYQFNPKSSFGIMTCYESKGAHYQTYKATLFPAKTAKIPTPKELTPEQALRLFVFYNNQPATNMKLASPTRYYENADYGEHGVTLDPKTLRFHGYRGEKTLEAESARDIFNCHAARHK